jgi:hypothetical protein
MKKSNALLALVLAVSLMIGIETVEVVDANPMFIEAPAPANSNPIIRIESPKENATYTNGTINVCFTVTGSKDPGFVDMSLTGWFKGDWMNNSERAYGEVGVYYRIPIFLQYNFNVTDIPFGEHSIWITASGSANFIKNNQIIPEYVCFLTSTLCVNFSVRNSPIITFPSAQNLTVTNSSFPLNFTVDHPVQEITYSLDGQKSLPINGNTTLTGLANGPHNVTVSATDASAYKGISDILYFYVDTPESPFVPLAVALAIALITIASISLVYFKRRKCRMP